MQLHLCLLTKLGYIRVLRVSRYNGLIHALASWLESLTAKGRSRELLDTPLSRWRG